CSALFKGVRLRHQLDTWLENKTFADTLIPCWTVATDVALGAEVVINHGPLADGIRASMSIPGAFNPWPHGGRRCIDGAVVNPMPASVLRDAGLRLVVGSNVAGQELPADALLDPHLLQIMSRMVNSMEREMIKAQVPLVDVLVRPKVGPASSFDFSRIDDFVLEGERAAREVLPLHDFEAVVDEAAAVDPEPAEGVVGLPSPFGRRTGVEQPLPAEAGGVDRYVAVAEDDEVGGGEAALQAAGAAVGRTGVVDHGDPQALD